MLKNNIHGYFRENKGAILFLLIIIFSTSLYTNCSCFFDDPKQLAFFPPFIEGVDHNDNDHLGAEYWYIAEALASGKGFSNPFQVDTGPTAWMPPLYPFLLAALIALLKTNILIACIIVFLKNLVLIFTGLVIYELAKETLVKLKANIALLFYVIWLLTNYRPFFQVTHDTWLLLLLVDVMFPLSVYIKRRTIGFRLASVWGVLGGVTVLTSPVLGIVWFIMSPYIISVKRNTRMLVWSMIPFLILLSSWTIRNYVVFNKFIFVKSNLFYDAYFANYVTRKNGLVDAMSFGANHPVWSAKRDPNSLYRLQGEVKFLEDAKRKLLDRIREKPDRYINNIINRLNAIFLIYHPHNPSEMFIGWKIFINILNSMGFLGAIILFSKNHPSADYLRMALFYFTIYIIPYVIVIYYIRYSLPLTPIKVLFVLWSMDLLWIRLCRKRPAMRSCR